MPPPAGVDGEEGKEAHPRNRCVVITLGSANVRIGRAGDRTPVQVPCTIAYRTPTKPTPSARGAEAQSTAQAQRRDAERAALEASYRKRHRVLNGIEYSDRNALTTMPADPNHWLEYTDKDRVIVGDDVAHIPPQAPFTIQRPIRDGVLSVGPGLSPKGALGSIERILRYAIEVKAKIPSKEWENYIFVVGVPDSFSVEEVCLVLDVLFKEMKLKSVSVHRNSVLSCYGAGVSSACVVDSGAESTHICCVIDGVVKPRTCISLRYGGDDIDSTLLWLLQTASDREPYFGPRGLRFDDPGVRDQVRSIKEKHCYLSEMGTELNVSDSQILVRVPGQATLIHRFNIATAGLVAPRLLFQPALLPHKGSDQDGKCGETESSNGVNVRSLKRRRLASWRRNDDILSELYLKDSGYYRHSLRARELGEDIEAPKLGRPTKSQSSQRALAKTLAKLAASGNATASTSELGGAKGGPGGAVVSPANIAAATQAGAAAAAAAAAGKDKKAKRKAAPRSLGPIPDRDPCMPLHIAITESIKSLRTMDHKVKLAKQVLLAGGTCNMRGLVDALEEELVAILPYRVPGANTVNVILNPKGVDAAHLAWRGASFLAHGKTLFTQTVIERARYLKCGSAALREKVPFPV